MIGLKMFEEKMFDLGELEDITNKLWKCPRNDQDQLIRLFLRLNGLIKETKLKTGCINV